MVKWAPAVWFLSLLKASANARTRSVRSNRRLLGRGAPAHDVGSEAGW